jgi:predicted metal-dependent hydrolase
MSFKEYYLPDIGKVKIYKKRGVKNISISVKPFEGVRVSIPFLVSYDRAMRFIMQKKSWIVKALSKTDFIEQKKTIFNLDSDFTTFNHQLVITQEPVNACQVRVANNKISVKINAFQDVESDEIQNSIRRGIEKAWSKEAKEILIPKVAFHANKFGLIYESVSVRKTVSRWGSCSSKNNISLSLYLMHVPEHLLDYVILHELAHTKVKNHSREFWIFLEKLQPNARQLSRELKSYKPGVY